MQVLPFLSLRIKSMVVTKVTFSFSIADSVFSFRLADYHSHGVFVLDSCSA